MPKQLNLTPATLRLLPLPYSTPLSKLVRIQGLVADSTPPKLQMPQTILTKHLNPALHPDPLNYRKAGTCKMVSYCCKDQDNLFLQGVQTPKTPQTGTEALKSLYKLVRTCCRTLF